MYDHQIQRLLDMLPALLIDMSKLIDVVKLIVFPVIHHFISSNHPPSHPFDFLYAS